MKKLTPKAVKNYIAKCGLVPLFDDIEYKNNKTRLKIQCGCGTVFFANFNSIQSGNTKTCGHCADPKIGDVFGKLTITNVKKSTKSCSITCLCNCGNMCGPYPLTQVLQNKTLSCGHCNDPKIGDRFGKLTVIEVMPALHKGCRVWCLCDCGRKWGPRSPKSLRNGKTTTCGHCGIKRGGRYASKIALQLQLFVEEILNCKCKHNVFINGRCFDIVCEDLKVIIEYDGYYWHRVHKNTSKQESRDIKIAYDNGYKFLRIKSSGRDMPTQKQILYAMRKLHTYKKWTITMESWKNEDAKQK